MNTGIKCCFIVAAALLVGVIGGFKVGANAQLRGTTRGVELDEECRTMLMLRDTQSVMAFLNVLKGLRAGEQKLMIDRLESFLDTALMDLARGYAPGRDPYKTAAKQLQDAKEYRSQHPYPNSFTNVVQMIDASLLRKGQTPR
jgi:hypothetical protein